MQTNPTDPTATSSSRASFFQRLLGRAGDQLSARMPVPVLLTGILVYLGVQLALVSYPILNRSVPVETDDAYTYILKAVQMQSCFRQDCPALLDLREQLLSPSEDTGIQWLRYREYGRAFFVYHPLHSVALIILKSAGLTWEGAYQIIVLAGSAFIGLSISYLLCVLFGPGPAGCALIFLAFNLFPGQGLHYIVPSNLSLGIAIFTWAFILRNRGRTGWPIIAGLLAMVSMHTTGRLYALVTLAVYMLVIERPFPRRSWATLGIGAAIILLTFTLPSVITKPELSMQPEPPPLNWQPGQGLRENFQEAARIVTGWASSYGGLFILGLLVSVGFFSMSDTRKQWNSIALFALNGGLLGVSLFFVLPRYPAEAFGRLWVPFAIVLTGYVGQTVWAWMTSIFNWISDLAHGKGVSNLFSSRRILSPRGWGSVALLVMSAGLLLIAESNLSSGAKTVMETARIMRWKQHTLLDSAQPEMLLSRGCGTVVYQHEVPMHFFFSRGGLACETVYFPALGDTKEKRKFIAQNKDIRYVVAWNPIIDYQTMTGGNSFTLSSSDKLEFHLDHARSLDSIWLNIENPGNGLDLNFRAQPFNESEEIIFKITVPAKLSGWLPINPQNKELVEQMVLNMPQSKNPILLRGVRVDANSALNWPWENQITLVYTSSDEAQPSRNIHFDSRGLLPRIDLPLRVLADNGDTVLAEVVNK